MKWHELKELYLEAKRLKLLGKSIGEITTRLNATREVCLILTAHNGQNEGKENA